MKVTVSRYVPLPIPGENDRPERINDSPSGKIQSGVMNGRLGLTGRRSLRTN
jgi:hypothetical protein